MARARAAAKGLDNFCMAARCIGLQRPGGYADHLLVPHPRYLIDASGIDPAWAATLSCSGLAAYSAVSKLNPIPPEEWVIVIGAGGLGLSAISLLRAMGHKCILAADIDNAKLNAAKEAGAAAVVNSRDADAAEQIKKISGGPIYGAVDLVGSNRDGEACPWRSPQGRPADPRWSLWRRDSVVAGDDDSTRAYDPGFSPRQRRGIEAGRCARARRQAPAYPDPKAAVVGSQPYAR